MMSFGMYVSKLILISALAPLLFCSSNTDPDGDDVLRLSLCSYSEFDPSTSFESNLNTLLSSLLANAGNITNNGYYATNTTALGAEDGEVIFGLFLCRGDTNNEDCKSCVVNGTANSPPIICPSDKSAAVWFDKIMVRYSNESFLGKVNDTANLPMENKNTVSPYVIKDVRAFIQLVDDTLSDLSSTLKSRAGSSSSEGNSKYYLTKRVTPSDKSFDIFAMVQCTPDLSPADCKSCLDTAISEMDTYCNGSKGCRMLNPSCNTRWYETYQFYNDKASPPPLQPPPPSLLPPPMPMLPSAPPFIRSVTKEKGKAGGSLVVNISLGILVLILVLLVTVLIFLQCKKRRNNNGSSKSDSLRSQAHTLENDYLTAESLQFDFATLKYATNNFSDVNKLGEGGFGAVYKGTLPNGQEVAVKRLSKGSHQGVEEFKNEVVFVAKLQHRNLVRLLGFHLAPDEMLLVYEFVPNKSLDQMLFDPERKSGLDWPTRYKIIHGIARGILYLHEDSRLTIVHRDLKASNILLDADMNPKISDFGLARNFAVNQKQDQTNRLAGTLGYMAPEYIEYGEISTKSDVYSFGVLVLEIITGRKISSRQTVTSENLLTYVWRHWNVGAPMEVVDSSLTDSYSSSEVTRCLHLGFLCVQGNIDQRPSMLSTVFYLNSSFDLPAPEQPAFINTTQKGLISEFKELFTDKSTKSGSSSRTSEQQSDKSTSRSTHSFSGIEV